MTYLRGPNLWTYRPVIEAWVDIGALEDSPSNMLPGFYERLSGWLPSLIEHRCGVGERGGFLQRVREGTWPAHILEHVAIELQNLAGMQSGFGKARETPVRGIYKVAVRARNEEVGRAALHAARDLVMAAIEDQPFDVKATLDMLREKIDRHHIGPSTAAIVQAAIDRRLPVLRMLSDGNLVQFGHGAAQRRIWTAETEHTSAIAESIASDKDLTKRLLSSCGVPVPKGRVVDNPDEAWEAAQEIGMPVVVKPRDANHARGVILDLTREEDIRAAFPIADAEGSGVMVERFIRGQEHRLLIVGNRMVAAARGEELYIIGNGKDSVEALIDAQLNSDPRRGDNEEFPLDWINLDHNHVIVAELSRQQLTRHDVPADGRKVLVQRNGNVAYDVTHEVHPDVAAAAALAARVVGLDIAGIDLVAEDIRRPLTEQGGAIIEVNAGPGLLMHLKPAHGEAQPIGQAIINHLFPDNDGRIPIVGITGTQGTTRIAQLLAALLRIAGRHVGLACRDGLFVEDRTVSRKDASGWDSGQHLLINRRVDTAIFESSAAAILRDGLPYDRCRVGVLTDSAGLEKLADYYLREPTHLFNVLRTQIDVVLSDGFAVLNAHDALVAEAAPLCDGGVIFYGIDGTLPVITEHRAHGGRAVFARDDKIVFAQGATETELPLHDTIDLEVVAAMAAASALDIDIALLHAGIDKYFAEQALLAAGLGSSPV